MYPISVNIKGKRCVVVGGGKVAERRVAGLREQEAQIMLVAPDATPALRELARTEALAWRQENYRNELLDGAFLVIAATNEHDINAVVARDAQARNLLICSADGFADGNFTTPSVIRRGDLVLTVSTGGNSPTLAALLRERLSQEFGPDWEPLTTLLGHLRGQVQALGSEAERRAAVSRLLDDNSLRDLIARAELPEAENWAIRLLTTPAQPHETDNGAADAA